MNEPVVISLSTPTVIEGDEYPADSVVCVVPMQITAQWLVDHPAPDDSTSLIWFALSSPDRIVATKKKIKEAIAELGLLMASEKRAITMARMRQHQSLNKAQKFLDESPERASRYNDAKTISKTLRQTSNRLEIIHESLKKELTI